LGEEEESWRNLETKLWVEELSDDSIDKFIGEEKYGGAEVEDVSGKTPETPQTTWTDGEEEMKPKPEIGYPLRNM
jgi:hypothetical protein